MRACLMLLATLLCAPPALAQEPPKPAPASAAATPPTTVAETLVALRGSVVELVDSLAATQFKVEPARYPGITSWLADWKVVRATFEGKPPSAWTFDVDALTTSNPDFWAATYEIYPSDPMFLAMIAALRIMAGEAYRANHLIFLGMASPKRPAVVRGAHQRLGGGVGHLFRLAHERIAVGIRCHDKGDFDGAIAAYRALLVDWPQDGLTHYELGQTLMLKSPEDMLKPDAPHAAEYALCRRYHPLEKMAWQGMTPEIVEKAMVMMTEVDPAWEQVRTGRADAATLVTLSEGAQKLGVHDLALFARQLLVAMNEGYDAADRAFIAISLRALVPGEVTERTIARLAADASPMYTIARFEGEKPDFKWKR